MLTVYSIYTFLQRNSAVCLHVLPCASHCQLYCSLNEKTAKMVDNFFPPQANSLKIFIAFERQRNSNSVSILRNLMSTLCSMFRESSREEGEGPYLDSTAILMHTER